MVDPITGAVLSGLVKFIFNKLGSPFFKEIGRVFGVKTELERLSHTLEAIDSVLVDAEEQQATLHSVRVWLLNLKDVAHDIEDVLDLISTQALENQVRERTLARFRQQLPDFSMAQKLKAICGRLEEISTNRRDFNFQERSLSVSPPVHPNGDRDQSPIIQESTAFGRKEEQDWIVSRLVSSSSHESLEIPVLPIVGIGGMGKTTLAKLVFNDPRVEEYFKIQLWVSMPSMLCRKTVIEKIFEGATGGNASDSNMQAIEKTTTDILVGQIFLLVLDNVWLEDSKEWVDLKKFLAVGCKGSRIIVTTRENRVASFTGTTKAHKLQRLSENDCWSIFVKYAFKKDEEKGFPALVRIGKEIVRKCCGVPLAAKTLGSQLWNVRDESSWRKIEESKLWNIKQAPDDILPALKLSFDQLPYYLKACFAFCSTATNNIYKRDQMVDYWMALGLTESTEMNGTSEDSGARYFNELVSRSFFEVLPAARHVPTGRENDQRLLKFADLMGSSKLFEIWGSFQMHDLVHELGRYVAGEETAFVSFDSHEVSARVKHLVWTEDTCFEGEVPSRLLTAKKARSLQLGIKKGGYISKSFLNCLISSFRCLRILSLAGFEFEDLPNSVGDLKHLRFLTLAWNRKLKRLPDSISRLVNLQILSVAGCRHLETFPRNLHRWISLRHLYFTSKLDSCLETCYHGWTSIQKISIWKCAYLTSVSEKIGTLTTLRVLEIKDCRHLASLPNSIQLLIALEQLDIWNCPKLNLSGWEGLNGLRNLRVLVITRLPLLVHFPDGLQHCTSLLKLVIQCCFNLSNLPRGIEALKNLQVLWMLVKNPVLQSRCKKEKGEDWNIISHIPIIQVY